MTTEKTIKECKDPMMPIGTARNFRDSGYDKVKLSLPRLY